MGFWNLSDGEDAAKTGAEYEIPGGNMDPIPAGSSVLAMIDEAKQLAAALRLRAPVLPGCCAM